MSYPVITDDQMLVLRTWVTWKPPSNTTLEDAFVRLGGIYQIAEEEIRRRLHERMAEPDSLTIPGDYEQRTGSAMDQLRAALNEVKVLAATERAALDSTLDGPIIPGRMVRVDPAGDAFPDR